MSWLLTPLGRGRWISLGLRPALSTKFQTSQDDKKRSCLKKKKIAGSDKHSKTTHLPPHQAAGSY